MGSLGRAQRCSAPAFPLDRWRDTRRPGRGSCRCRRRRRRRRSPGAASFTGCASEHGVVRQATRSSFRSSSRLLDDHFRFVVTGPSGATGTQRKGGSGPRGQVPSSRPMSTVFLLPASRDDYTDDKESTDAKYTPTTTRPIRREKRRDQFHCRQPPAPPKRLQTAANLPSTRIRARIIAPVTPSPPATVLTPSMRVHRWVRV